MWSCAFSASAFVANITSAKPRGTRERGSRARFTRTTRPNLPKISLKWSAFTFRERFSTRSSKVLEGLMEPSARSIETSSPWGDCERDPERLRASALGLLAAGDEERETERRLLPMRRRSKCGVVVEWTKPKLVFTHVHHTISFTKRLLLKIFYNNYPLSTCCWSCWLCAMLRNRASDCSAS